MSRAWQSRDARLAAAEASDCPKCSPNGNSGAPHSWPVEGTPASPPTSSFPSRCPFGFGGATCQDRKCLSYLGGGFPCPLAADPTGAVG